MFPCLHRELCNGIQRQRSVHKNKTFKGSSIDLLLFMSAAFKNKMKLANGDAGALLESIGKKEEPKEERNILKTKQYAKFVHGKTRNAKTL